MDDLTKYNIARWKALVEADALFTRPALSLDPVSARHLLDPEGRIGGVASKDVLCLACGGGQQSICVSVIVCGKITTEAQRTQKLHRESSSN